MKTQSRINYGILRLSVFANLLLFGTAMFPGSYAVADLPMSVRLETEGLELTVNERNIILQRLLAAVDFQRHKKGWQCVDDHAVYDAARIPASPPGEDELADLAAVRFVVRIDHARRDSSTGTMMVPVSAKILDHLNGEGAERGEIEKWKIDNADRAAFLAGETGRVLTQLLENMTAPCLLLKIEFDRKNILVLEDHWKGEAPLHPWGIRGVDSTFNASYRYRHSHGCTGSGSGHAQVSVIAVSRIDPSGHAKLTLYDLRPKGYTVNCRYGSGTLQYGAASDELLTEPIVIELKEGVRTQKRFVSSSRTIWDVRLEITYIDN